jgi:hypothetical protein
MHSEYNVCTAHDSFPSASFVEHGAPRVDEVALVGEFLYWESI